MRTITAIFFLAAALVTACSGGDESPQLQADTVADSIDTESTHSPSDGDNAGPAGLPQDAVRLAPNAVVDWTGFGQPIVAATLFTPHDWTAQGGIEWGNQHMCVNGYAYNWTAQSPDGLTGVGILPQQKWEWNQTGAPLSPGCPVAQIDSVEAYQSALLQQIRPDAKVLGYKQRADLEKDFAALNSTSNTGFQLTEARLYAGDTFVSYQENGTPMRGVITSAVLFTYIRTGGAAYGATVENWSGYALPSFAAFAPEDSFNPSLYEAIRRSFAPDPNWERAIASHNSKMAQINLDGVRKRSEITRQTSQSIREMSQSAWESRQKSMDYSAREFSEYLRDVETYSDPQSTLGQVELDSSYDHAWRLDDGTYVLTNDQSFNPVASTGQFGEQLGVAP